MRDLANLEMSEEMEEEIEAMQIYVGDIAREQLRKRDLEDSLGKEKNESSKLIENSEESQT